ncbi:hypothetical protein [Hymenobacter psychrotolerans]|uniref:Uncharacterized protein n=1 Tax=Hymenobacter psychrotolerans DSM 18569 TaxID=1121959 RepID=A0A1M6TLL1_9BACT|nr:hypothetical protein [Hymenobacter psychrotolerans]SHK57769.1 hypothetical protein SAMN02746009_01155 [Hymenobacter psychrotolerans DSM 18569]
MKIVQDEVLKSGWQPRPHAVPSAGKALSVLVAVCAVLWVWNMDWWPRPQYQLVADIIYSYWMCALLAAGSNYIVFRWATWPLWKRPHSDNGRTLVLLLCLAFHVAWLLVMGCIGLLALAFSSSPAGSFDNL